MMLRSPIQSTLLLFANIIFHGKLMHSVAYRIPWVSRSCKPLLFSTLSDGEINPKDVYIPVDKIDFSFTRSSGPGGQNVNKVNTKAEIRFNVHSADWLQPEVKQRLIEYQSSKINNDGSLYLSSQEHRTQEGNKKECLSKLREMVAEAMLEPKVRALREGISDKGKEQRKDYKRKRADIKKARGSNRDDW